MPHDGEAATRGGFEIVVDRADGDVAVIRIGGELDLATSEQLDRELEPLIQDSGGRRIVLDLSDVLFLDSTGLRVLWAARQRSQSAGGRLLLASPSEPVMRVLRVTKLDKVFHIVDGDGADVTDT